MRKLEAADREFLAKVSDAAFANPFGEDRQRLNRSISGVATDEDAGEGTAQALDKVRAFFRRLDNPKTAVAGDFSASDWSLVRQGLLFVLFHDCLERMDALIEKQVQTGDGSCRVDFADEVLREMLRHGMDKEDALKSFALFFQLRRAFYFIETSLVGGSASMQRLRYNLWNNVFTGNARLYVDLLWERMEDFSSLILGETGTGKGAAAAAIGRSGFIPFVEQSRTFQASFMSTFIDINLSQFSESLIESELFGHRKGAFTGAVESHEGILLRCSRYGSVFLDEIGDVSIPVQIKLLRVLQDRTFTPVGSHRKQRFSGRVIAATNRPLDELRRQGKFRDDFYYRLCSDVIAVPALRRRIREDSRELEELSNVVVRRIIGSDDREVTAFVLERIVESVGPDYAWPGNVRELEQCVRSILLSGTYSGMSSVEMTDIDRLHAGIDAGSYDAAGLLADYCRRLYKEHGTYEAVARISGLDRRTVKKHILNAG